MWYKQVTAAPSATNTDNLSDEEKNKFDSLSAFLTIHGQTILDFLTNSPIEAADIAVSIKYLVPLLKELRYNPNLSRKFETYLKLTKQPTYLKDWYEKIFNSGQATLKEAFKENYSLGWKTVRDGIDAKGPLLNFLKKAEPILKRLNYVDLVIKVGLIIEKLIDNKEIEPKDTAELISKLLQIPLVASVAGPFAPALMAAGFITDAVGVQIAEKAGEIAGDTNPSNDKLQGILSKPESLKSLGMSFTDLKEDFGEVYNALIDLEKGLSFEKSLNKHIPDLDPYKSQLLLKFYLNRDKLKQVKGTGEELYPASTSAYVKSSYYNKRKEQEQKSRYYGPTKPMMQN
jgi:hypothetical protein